MNHRPDYLLCRIIVSTIAVIFCLIIVFIPKKPKHRKRSNTVSSAFSIASTPDSFQSSIVQRGLTDDDSRTVLLDDDELASVASFRTSYSTRSNKSLASTISKRTAISNKSRGNQTHSWKRSSLNKKDSIDDAIQELDSLNGGGCPNNWNNLKESGRKKQPISQLLTDTLTLYSTEDSSDEDVLKNLDFSRTKNKLKPMTSYQKTQWRKNLDTVDW